MEVTLGRDPKWWLKTGTVQVLPRAACQHLRLPTCSAVPPHCLPQVVHKQFTGVDFSLTPPLAVGQGDCPPRRGMRIWRPCPPHFLTPQLMCLQHLFLAVEPRPFRK